MSEDVIIALGDFLRSMVRPFLVMASFVSLMMIVFEGIDAPAWFLALAGGIVGEWPAERAIKRALGR